MNLLPISTNRTLAAIFRSTSSQRIRLVRSLSRGTLLTAMALLLSTTKALLSSSLRARQSYRRVTQSSPLDDLFEMVLKNHTTTMAATTTTRSSIEVETRGEWQTADWNSIPSENYAELPPSPVEVILVRDRLLYLKRDDLLRLPGSQVSGNKARKMLSLAALPDDVFPTCIVSYGGPQSNAMLALAAMVHFRNQASSGASGDESKRKRFVYHTKKLPRFLRSQPSGNLFRAQSLGMELCELSHDEYHRLFGGDWAGHPEAPPSLPAPIPKKSLWIPQGGACAMAQAGTHRLAQEIVDFWKVSGKGRPLSVLIPGGTCSTALLTHHAMKHILTKQRDFSLDIQVVVVPCVGDEGYARRQMMTLNSAMGFPIDELPLILPPASGNGPSRRYFTFGEPYREVLDVWTEMRDAYQINLDLLYGAPSWAVLFSHWQAAYGDSNPMHASPISGRAVMYVHSGGLEGINTQLMRYKHKQLIDVDQIQPPGRAQSNNQGTSPSRLQQQ